MQFLITYSITGGVAGLEMKLSRNSVGVAQYNTIITLDIDLRSIVLGFTGNYPQLLNHTHL